MSTMGGQASPYARQQQTPAPYTVAPGRPHPLGATPDAAGINFSLFSEHATGACLLLFGRHDDPEPLWTIQLDPMLNRTYHFWHVYVVGLRPGIYYAYRMEGPDAPHLGTRFNPRKVLLDPYARAITTTLWSRADASGPNDNLGSSMRAEVADHIEYNWEGDRPLTRAWSDTIIYELHVKGFTFSPSSGCTHPGTFAAMTEKISYLTALGVTAVELLPVFTFDPTDVDRINPENVAPLTNYWGYNSIGFFSLHDGYCIYPQAGRQIREFRDMVKAFHGAGIEVILDVCLNHTSEGNHLGPTINFKGLDNSIYYFLDPAHPEHYQNFSGTGNTLNCNHPIVDKLIIDSLEFWVREMHVDGFRFDEASILSRGEDGTPMTHPPVIWQIELSEVLADTKIIAEAWDAAGLYQIGDFPGYRWAEWNGRYRDDIRRFLRGDAGMTAAVASRVSGSADIYEQSGRLPTNSINFVTCHDGFTLNDLVSYNEKHNEANGENNRDGADANWSWNCGTEGESADGAVSALRLRQMRNFVTILLLSQGVPMLLSGDEIRRTQRGNNNAYCQDNELNWFDWTACERHADLLRFFTLMIAFRKRHSCLHRGRFFSGKPNTRGLKDIDWHGTELFQPRWDDPTSRILAFTIAGDDREDGGGQEDIHAMLNMDAHEHAFALPITPGKRWHLAVDTSRTAPEDIAEAGSELVYDNDRFLVVEHSVAVLVARGVRSN